MNEKFDHLGNSRDWLPRTWRNRSAHIRLLGFQLASKLASSKKGAELLTEDFTDLWKTLFDILLDGAETFVVKTIILETLYNLLVLVSIFKAFQ